VLKSITNPLYEHNSSTLWPSVYGQTIVLWSGLYLRYQRNENPFKEAKNEIFKLVDLNKRAKANVESLRK
jgi:myotubularin-related protein 9